MSQEKPEIYGENKNDVLKFDENYLGYINCNTLRAGYPESKRLSESLCQAYISQYDLDIVKVVFMLAIHELGETVIGDLTQFQISKAEKEKLEHEAVHKILEGLLDGETIEELFLEFDSHSTKEAMFAYQCDKLECDLQCKLYDEEGAVDLSKQEGNKTMNNDAVKSLLDDGASWSTMWLKFGQQTYPYDDNFRAVSNFAINNKIKQGK